MGYNIIRRFFKKQKAEEVPVNERDEDLQEDEQISASISLSILEGGEVDVSLKYNDDGLLSQMCIAELLTVMDETKFGQTILETLLKDDKSQEESILLVNIYKLYIEFRSKGPAVSPRDVFKT